ncbi:MAG: hypothetical protein PHO63_06085 [Bacilli bacterium]|nr:hypothetical protein [Bacilli bacterium]MDD4809165.1 hypothetical protein [Bacilli bacterium]
MNLENPDQIYLIILLVSAVFLFGFLMFLLFKPRKKEEKKVTVPETAPVVPAQQVNPPVNQPLETNLNTQEINNVLMSMQQQVEKRKEDPVLRFEEAQEEDAIISYSELLRTKQQAAMTSVEPSPMHAAPLQDQPTPIEIIDFPVTYREPVSTIEKKPQEEPTRFTNTEIISPIFGRMTENGYPSSEIIEDVPATKPSPVTNNPQTKYNDQFLKELKEFRKNL